MLNCPDCHRALILRKVKTHSGGEIEVDQCPVCGGIWFDHFKVNQVPLPEIKKLAPQTPQKPPKSQNFGKGKCPHCLAPLIPLRGESIPHYLNVFSCPQCRGNWFSQKDLFEFKVAQKAKIDYFKLWQLPLPSTFAVLLPVLILSILTLSIPAVLIGFKTQEEVRIRAGEVIIRPTVINLNPTSVIITWATTVSLTSEIKYWTEEFLPKTMIVSPKPATNHTIELKNLSPQTLYFYQLILKDGQGNEIPSELYSFTTRY